MVSYKLVRDASNGMYRHAHCTCAICPQSLHIIMYMCNLHYLNSHTHTHKIHWS